MELATIRQFRSTLRRFERDVAIRQKRDERTGGLSVVQCHTVIALGELGETTIGEMAVQMGVDKSTLSRTLDTLVEKTLVDRREHATDRRYLLVRLTDKGRQVCDHLNRVNDDFIARVFARIPEQGRSEVMKHVEQFVSALRAENGE